MFVGIHFCHYDISGGVWLEHHDILISRKSAQNVVFGGTSASKRLIILKKGFSPSFAAQLLDNRRRILMRWGVPVGHGGSVYQDGIYTTLEHQLTIHPAA